MLSQDFLQRKIIIKNTTPYEVHYDSATTGKGVMLKPNGEKTIKVEEFINEVDAENSLFCGVGEGHHAYIATTDMEVLEAVGFENQQILTDDVLIKLFEGKANTLKERLSKNILTYTDKALLRDFIKSGGTNEYDKIVIANEFVGVKF
ncbi:MAG: hypothetical protein FWE04_01700 [Oscillospiraceae bacterium]|nr:hypothetical protein [Oscillospiraceae bacterium]